MNSDVVFPPPCVGNDAGLHHYLRTKVVHQVVAEGIDGLIRHPMYTSFSVLLATCLLLTASWLIGALGLSCSLLIVERADHEERMPIDRFGDEYRAHMRRTGRFLPRLANDEEKVAGL